MEWKKVYMFPRIVTMDSSLHSFQYKILNNILYLNERLYKFNIVDSLLCSFCGAYNESIKHLFCTCMVTQRLWDQLQSWMHEVIFNFRAKNSYFRFMERENFELYAYQSCYLNIQALYLPQEKRK